jgi:3-hydroxyisobutyrate dehydrogenase-like beta-hydroxyacid dehydrogenase
MDTVGYIGVGKMGGPVAEHIQAAGFPMVVYDLSDASVAPFVARGAKRASSPAEVARMSDVIYTALPTPQDVEKVALGPQGILEGIKPGGVYVDISTGGPDLIRRIAAEFRKKDAWAVDAPVSIGLPGAANGIHEIMVGAERSVFERILPILKAYGDQIIHAGDVGAGSICKLVHQMVGCGVTQAIAEGLTLGVKAGVDVTVVWDSVRRGLVGRMHMMHDQIPQSVFSGVYEPTVFTLSLLRKDLGLATALGRQHNVPLLVSNVVEQIVIEGINRGWGNGSGYVVTYQRQEEAAGVSLRANGVDPVKASKFISTHPELSDTGSPVILGGPRP